MTTHRLLALAVAAVATRAAAGDIRGTVNYSGTPPKLPPLTTTRDQKVCGPNVPSESIIVSNGKLENVVITVTGAGVQKPAPKTITLDQRECRYRPHVQVAPAGSTLEILNSDPMLHNIHSYMGQQTLFNLAMPLKGQKISRPLPRAGLVRIKCDVHDWMNGWLVVADAPYAVVGQDGRYTIKDLPAGAYTVTAWHEKLGQQTSQVNVPGSGEVAADFTFSGSGGPAAGAR